MRWTLLFLLTLATGCGGSDEVVIGSKNFTEQIILGEILAQQIERKTGLEVDRRFNLGGTFICDIALRSGDIDAYVEYTGTAFTAILKQEPVSDPQRVYLHVKEDYQKRDLEWLEPLGFNNTFAIMIRADEARKLGVKSLSEAVSFAPEWVAGFGYEFMERKDGFKGLARTYGLSFADTKVMELGLMYRALAAGSVDLIAGNSTEGLVAALDLFILEDDLKYFSPYYAAPVVRSETLRQHPELLAALLALKQVISEKQMRIMNYQVDGERKLVKQVVAGFLATIDSSGGPLPASDSTK